jgi:hypothetical protein
MRISATEGVKDFSDALVVQHDSDSRVSQFRSGKFILQDLLESEIDEQSLLA